MGMQCSFDYTDLSDRFATNTIAHEDGTYSVQALVGTTVISTFNFSRPIDSAVEDYFCWFDVGSANERVMNELKFLIRNHIPFTCA
jgi:hypothetical protein